MSFFAVYEGYLQWLYGFYGLKSIQVQVDPQTTLHCWAPKVIGKNGRLSLLLLHGFGARALVQWDKQLGPLSKHFDLFIPDLVFFGTSTTSSSERSEKFQAACCSKLMEYFGVSKYHLLGYSYGGAVAYNLALEYPKSVQKLVVLATGILATPSDMKQMMERLGVESVSAMQPRDVEGIRRLLRLAYYQPPWVPNFILKEVLKTMFSKEMPKEREELQLENRMKMVSGEPYQMLPPVSQETLIIQGEFDPLFPPELGENLKKHLGESGKFVVIPKTAHMPQAERPNDVNKVLLDFLTV